MPDPNDMLYFAEVAERSSFSAASRFLGIPKSRLSRRVAELESQLGIRLLQRTTRSLSLTEFGQHYLHHCLALRDTLQAATDAATHVQSTPRGTVRLSCPVTLAQTVIAPLLPDYLAQHPLVRLEMQVTNRIVHVVEEGLDFALRVRTSLEDSASLVVKRLGWGRQWLVAAPSLLARQGTPRSPEDLAQSDYLAMTATEGRSRLELLGPQGQRKHLQLQPRMVADDLLTLKFAALAGMGICWLPDYLCHEELTQGHLVRILEPWQPPEGIVHAVFPSRQGMSAAVRSLLDYLAHTVPERSHLQPNAPSAPSTPALADASTKNA